MTTILKPFERTRSPFLTIGDSCAKQSFKAECDINNILKKYKKTGLLSHVSKYQGRYEDLSQPTDYQTALNLVIEAQIAFDSLPAEIRSKFSNDPSRFLDFVNNPENETQMIDMGLLPPKPLENPSPSAPPIVTDEPETPKA